jgi:glycosyltransferase involved in cell wall biosynthesis
MKKLSVIIPAYNEGKRITSTLLDIHNVLSKQSFDYEILVVNDGSRDDTVSVVKSLDQRVSKLFLSDNDKNHGKGWAVNQGMLKATGDIRLFMDADNSTKIEEIFKMLPYFENGFDVVIGSRRIVGSQVVVQQPFFRTFLGWVFRTIVHALIPTGVVDLECGFKLFTEKAVKIIFPKQTVFGWIFDVEILSIARKNKLKVKEVPIIWRDDNESHMNFSAMAKSLLDIIRIKFK